MSNQDKIKEITKEDLNKLIEKFLSKLAVDDWGTEIAVEGLPKKFSITAIRKIMTHFNENIFKLFNEATGVAFLRNHHTVEEMDSESAIEVRERGISEVIPIPVDNEW